MTLNDRYSEDGRPVGYRTPAERAAAVQHFLELEVWPALPGSERGRRLSRAEEDELLGYGPAGV